MNLSSIPIITDSSENVPVPYSTERGARDLGIGCSRSGLGSVVMVVAWRVSAWLVASGSRAPLMFLLLLLLITNVCYSSQIVKNFPMEHTCSPDTAVVATASLALAS